ncbi:MAG: orotidine-5'-phosphate decarboxylase [Armatimonadota bacterium]|nr:orotidine-5'-phosphate decarboxylase [Armatimonadota bacterium]MCX7777127.1 orotidine-5'-phosphate decarboxylase [Armatimonadota bacterium]MDW8025174.1 orotidine-5'-phosphate decarboxylase [Armatimonadota bacterium]
MKNANQSPSDRLIIAADVRTRDEATLLTEELMPLCRQFKVGCALICSAGFNVAIEMTKMGASVLIDLKLHDIPNTVYEASFALSKYGIWALTVHACGGLEMIKACILGTRNGAMETSYKPPLVFAVTLLTSISEQQLNDELQVKTSVSEYVVTMAKLAKLAGADGVVASGREINDVREACGNDLLILVPGVRPSWAAADDQRRYITPAEAIKRGANYIIVGRPILRAENRRDALMRVLDEIASAI